MANRITSKSPFKGKPNRRAGTGPIYNRFNTPPNISNNSGRTSRVVKTACFGPYDNVTNYVWEVDTTTGDHLAYVDCDYV